MDSFCYLVEKCRKGKNEWALLDDKINNSCLGDVGAKCCVTVDTRLSWTKGIPTRITPPHDAVVPYGRGPINGMYLFVVFLDTFTNPLATPLATSLANPKPRYFK